MIAGSRTARSLAAAAAAVALSACAGAPETAGIVPDAPTLSLKRDRYVLPPEPAPPEPLSYEERRRLEVEWPPVAAWPSPRPDRGVVRVRSTAGAAFAGYRLPHCDGRATTGRPCRGAPVQAGGGAGVVVRVRTATDRAPPRVVLERRLR